MEDALYVISEDTQRALKILLLSSFDENDLPLESTIFTELFDDIKNHNNDCLMFNISLALARQYTAMEQEAVSLATFKIMITFLNKIVSTSLKSTDSRSLYESDFNLTNLFYNWLRIALTGTEESRDSSGTSSTRGPDDRGESTIMDIPRIRH